MNWRGGRHGWLWARPRDFWPGVPQVSPSFPRMPFRVVSGERRVWGVRVPERPDFRVVSRIRVFPGRDGQLRSSRLRAQDHPAKVESPYGDRGFKSLRLRHVISQVPTFKVQLRERMRIRNGVVRLSTGRHPCLRGTLLRRPITTLRNRRRWVPIPARSASKDLVGGRVSLASSPCPGIPVQHEAVPLWRNHDESALCRERF